MTKSTETRTLDPLEVPQSKDAALILLRNLGYEHITIFRVEDDRVLFTVRDEFAFTLCLDFDQENEKVHLRSVEGWPA